ncbi:hypothetical protein FOZ63_006257, partial [Perkinsus olseni]
MSNSYYTDLITSIGSEDLHVKAEHSDDRGMGLYATEPLEAGETLWAERPLLGALVRAFDRPLCVCETCGRFLGSLQLQLKYGLGMVSSSEMAKVFNDGDEEMIHELLFIPELPKVPGEAARLTDETPCLWQADGEVAKEGDMEYLLLATKVILGFSGADDGLREG